MMEEGQELIGCRVQLHSLKGHENNGRQGICFPHDLKSQDQVVVRLDDGKDVSVSPDNLVGVFRRTIIENKGISVVADKAVEAGSVLIYEKPVLWGAAIGPWRYQICGAAGSTAWFFGCCARAWLGACLLKWLAPWLNEYTGALEWNIWGALLGSVCPTRFTEAQFRWLGCFLGSYLGSYLGASAGGFLTGLAAGFTKDDAGSQAGLLSGATSLRKQFKKLPIATRASIMTLHDGNKWFRSLPGIFCTNAIPTGAALGEVVLCLWISRFNHSCRPNAVVQWNPEMGVQMLRAVQPIQAGEEICISYLGEDILERCAVRLKKLRSSFGFECRCAACVENDPDSDGRLDAISALLTPESQSASFRNPVEEMERLGQVLELLEIEGFTDPNAWIQALTSGFHLAVRAGRVSDVQTWAERARDEFSKFYGQNDVKTQIMKDFAKTPPTSQEELIQRGWSLGA